jgi:hypothetical protein
MDLIQYYPRSSVSDFSPLKNNAREQTTLLYFSQPFLIPCLPMYPMASIS